MSDLHTCPSCNGKKQHSSTAFVDGVDKQGHRRGWQEQIVADCYLCSGTGQITKQAMELYNAGRAAREDRISRGVSLREEAKRLGVRPSELSWFEIGHRALPEVKP